MSCQLTIKQKGFAKAYPLNASARLKDMKNKQIISVFHANQHLFALQNVRLLYQTVRQEQRLSDASAFWDRKHGRRTVLHHEASIFRFKIL